MIVIYSKEGCPGCVQAKSILSSKSIKFKVIDGDDAVLFMQEKGHRSFPQVYKDGVLFTEGGHVGLLKMLRAGTLK
jgi:glutaredoxin